MPAGGDVASRETVDGAVIGTLDGIVSGMVGLEDGPAIERDREIGDAIGAEHRFKRGNERRERDEIRERLRDEEIRTVLVEDIEGVTRFKHD